MSSPLTSTPETRGGMVKRLLVWSVALISLITVLMIVLWQINANVYSQEQTVEQYREALSEGDGATALGFFSETPEVISDSSVDHVLLSGAPLVEALTMVEDPNAEQSTAEESTSEEAIADESTSEGSAGQQSSETSPTVPLVDQGTQWGLFDQWGIAAEAVTEFTLNVPGAVEAGIGQVQVNGAPVNLDDGSAQLSAFIPSGITAVAESRWISGQTEALFTTAPPGEPSPEVTVDLTASDEAQTQFRAAVAQYFDSCAQQQVLMPTGCPVGVSTSNQVDPESINWQFPDPEQMSLVFDDSGWNLAESQLNATVSYDAVDFFTGEPLSESTEVPFTLSLDVAVSSDDFEVSVREG